MNKLQSVYLKGWAVLFMMFYHFGGNLIAPEWRYDWSGNDWNKAFQMCVPIFLFLSGYGLMASYKNNVEKGSVLLQMQIVRALKLLKHYWFVTSPFIIIALCMGKFQWSWESFVLTFTSVKCVWCPFAWFISLYIELILLFPIFIKIFKRNNEKLDIALFMGLIIVTKITSKIGWVDAEAILMSRQIKMLMIDIPIFINGFLFAKYGIFEMLCAKIYRINSVYKIMGGVILIVLSISFRAKIPLIGITELVHVPACLIGLLLIGKVSEKMFSAIIVFGKHSTTLWLIHSYFLLTFFQPLIYSLRIWSVAFCLFVGMCLVVSFILDNLYLKINSIK